MHKHIMPALTLGKHTAPVPIVQGGMGVGISGASLASAVAEQGGIGVVSGVVLGLLQKGPRSSLREANIDAMRQEIRAARKKTSGMLGVNLMVAATDYEDLLEAALEEDINALFLGAGLPLHFSENVTPQRMQESGKAFVPIVSSAKAARVILKYWSKHFGFLPDGFVLEGPKAGGHLGFKPEEIDDPNFALKRLLPEVLKAVKPFEEKFGRDIPIIAAGGIYTGYDIAEIMTMGAKGVQMGTRFVATNECDADDSFKQAFVQAQKKDLTIIKSPVGLPGRAIRSPFLDSVERGEKIPFKCPWHCLRTCDYTKSPYCISKALVQARKGNLNHGFAFAGANAWRVDRIMPVKELMDSLADEYAQSVEYLDNEAASF
ncbi:MAG: nitronate monooxygenase family protein [Desulfovibrionales bacterium]